MPKSQFDPNAAFKSIVGLKEPDAQQEIKKEAPVYPVQIVKKEVKSVRGNLLLPPSLHKQVMDKCKKNGISFNELVNQLLNYWLKKEE